MACSRIVHCLVMMLLYAFSRKISLVTQQDFEANRKFLGRERKSSVFQLTFGGNDGIVRANLQGDEIRHLIARRWI